MMNPFPYIVTLASIVGTVANSFRKRWCFWVWMGTNTFWCIYNAAGGSFAQAMLYAFNFAMAVVGLIRWKRAEERTTKDPPARPEDGSDPTVPE